MAQAKRKSTSKSAANHQQSFQGVGMLLIGMVIGSLATLFWQGMQATDNGIGAGIRDMITQSKKQDQEATDTVREQDTPVNQEITFGFYTVLPGIEVVVPTIEQDSLLETPQINTAEESTDKPADTRNIAKTNVNTNASAGAGASVSTYMLQAASYKNKADAERLKAELAFQGLVAAIQKVSIQDRGDFYRVRLGPYARYDEMVVTDKKLMAQGIKALRLKISKGG